jgi:hypothetical protein
MINTMIRITTRVPTPMYIDYSLLSVGGWAATSYSPGGRDGKRRSISPAIVSGE